VRVRVLLYLLAAGLLAGSLLLVGCGTGGQQNGQSKGSKAGHTTQKATGNEKTSKQGAPSWHTFKGTVASALPDKNNLTVKPKNGEAKTFKYKPDKVEVELDGKKAEPEAINKGQHAKVKYLQYTKVNIAHSLKLHTKKSGNSGGETTG